MSLTHHMRARTLLRGAQTLSNLVARLDGTRHRKDWRNNMHITCTHLPPHPWRHTQAPPMDCGLDVLAEICSERSAADENAAQSPLVLGSGTARSGCVTPWSDKLLPAPHDGRHRWMPSPGGDPLSPHTHTSSSSPRSPTESQQLGTQPATMPVAASWMQRFGCKPHDHPAHTNPVASPSPLRWFTDASGPTLSPRALSLSLSSPRSAAAAAMLPPLRPPQFQVSAAGSISQIPLYTMRAGSIIGKPLAPMAQPLTSSPPPTTLHPRPPMLSSPPQIASSLPAPITPTSPLQLPSAAVAAQEEEEAPPLEDGTAEVDDGWEYNAEGLPRMKVRHVGITWHKQRSKWHVHRMVGDKARSGGLYDLEDLKSAIVKSQQLRSEHLRIKAIKTYAKMMCGKPPVKSRARPKPKAA